MLGNCLIRLPVATDGTLDAGSLCEALLFFAQTHVVLDDATLALFVRYGFLDDFIEMLERGYLTANYAPEMAALYTDNRGGLREHKFTIVRFGGTQEHGEVERSADVLLIRLERIVGDRARAKKYHRRLCKFVSFKNLDGGEAVKKASDDIGDPRFAKLVARASLEKLGVPANEIRFSKLDIIALEPGTFAVDTDIDFSHLGRFVPAEPDLGAGHLFPAVGSARLDISLAAQRNAAFIGNGTDQKIVEAILSKTLGATTKQTRDGSLRQIYDFISVDTPSVRETINSGVRTPREFFEILESAAAFQNWLTKQNPDKDLIQEMLREKAKVSWLETLPIKTARLGLFGGAGMITDMFAPGSSLALSAVDSFLLNQISQRWRPHFFVENQLRGFLDRA
jgi:hypothetical protein